jgi:phosphoribosyl 1,2-cyclic phosphodiesterase
MLRLCVLGSGSRGNAIFLGDGETSMLVDAGLSALQIKLRLAKIGVPLDSINAVLLSHEHADHNGGIPILLKNTDIKCYANRDTAEETFQGRRARSVKVFSTGESFSIGHFHIHPFNVPHDAIDPVGFEIRHFSRKIAVATDLGCATTLVRQVLKDADYLILEANHDKMMLENDTHRPWALKQRIAGKFGHLSNDDSGKLLSEVACPHLKLVFLAHISRDCNTKSLAEATVRRYLKESGNSHVDILPTHQDEIAEPIAVA